MNLRQKKIAAAIAGLAVATAVAVPVVFPEQVAAKWLNWTGSRVVQVQAASDNSEVVQAFQADDVNGEWAGEVVVVDQKGNSQRVTVIDAAEGTVKTFEIDKQAAEKLQTGVDNGQQAWLLDPVQVVKGYADKYGFSVNQDTFTLVSQTYKGYSGTGEAVVLVQHGDRSYLVRLVQPNGSGANKIWQISSIKEVKAVSNTKPDVGPGVEGLDYGQIVAWQQAVDAGRELWRLDPLQVAKIEGKAYGFTDSDTYTIVRKMSSTALARHGQIDIEVNHKGKIYTMILVKPLGGPDAIWTTYSVSGSATPDKPSDKPSTEVKVLYKTDKYAGWDWYKGQYPKDMAFATIVDYEFQRKNDNRIPETVLERVKDIDFSQKVAILAYLGTVPSGGYNIGIEKVTMSGNNMTVQVRTKSPRPGEMVTMALASHSSYITLDRNIVDIWGGVNITFVDQDGKVLEKHKVTISHRN